MATDKKFVVKNGLQAQNIDFVDSTTATPTATLTASMNGSSVLSFDSGTLEIDGANNTVSAITFTASGDITADEVFVGSSTDHKIGKVNHTYGDGIGLTTDSGTVTIGQANGSYMHYVNSNTVPHWFSHSVVANGGFSVWGASDNFTLKNGGVVWEGATVDTAQTTLNVVDPTTDRTITLPDASGTVLLQDSNENVTITDTNASAGSGPLLYLYRNSSSPAASDYVGEIIVKGRNDCLLYTSDAADE